MNIYIVTMFIDSAIVNINSFLNLQDAENAFIKIIKNHIAKVEQQDIKNLLNKKYFSYKNKSAFINKSILNFS